MVRVRMKRRKRKTNFSSSQRGPVNVYSEELSPNREAGGEA
jgi:hypothetical protein